MKRLVPLLMFGLLAPLHAQHPMEWDASAGVLPSESVPSWPLFELQSCAAATATFVQDALVVDSSSCALNIHAYQYARTGAQPPPVSTYWVEADVRVRSTILPNNGLGAGTLRLTPGQVCPFSLEFSQDELAVRYAIVGELARVPIDTTSRVRTWRLEFGSPATARVFVDGQLLLTLPGPFPNTCSFAPNFWGSVGFGDFQQGQGGVVEWHAVRHGLGLDAYEFCLGGTLNSAGRSARLAWSGSRSVALNAFTLEAQDAAPNALAYFLCSAAAAPPSPVQASQATLCLGAPVGRMNRPGEVLQTTQSGAASLAIDLTRLPQPNGTIAAAVGERWHFQLWYRDANPGPTSNMSAGLQVLFE